MKNRHRVSQVVSKERPAHYRAVSALGCESSALVTDEPGT
jgi:hypothetical protein